MGIFTIKTHNPTQTTIGGYTRYPLSNGEYRWYDNQGRPLNKEATVDNWILKTNGTKVHVSARKANAQIARDNTQSATNPSVAFSPIDPEYRNLYKDQEKTVQQSTTDTTTTKTGKTKAAIRSKITPKGQAYWDKQYQDFKSKMTDDQKAWLTQRGIDYNSAEQLQDYLQRIGKKNIGKFGVDNKWGGDSQKAWEDFVNTTMKNNPLQTPVEEPEPVVDAPDPFGYKTSNTYEDDDFTSKLKRMGIRSNADLINFMYKSGKEGWKGDAWQIQFRNDVDRLLGGDYSDANIRKVFNTQGNWGNGFMGRGDFGDFQNALQTNAGVWNGMYDAKQNEARMDAARQQYATKLSQQFAPQLPKPTVNDPSNKFMVGNIGATTLGNLPSTKPINLSQEFTKDVKELNIPDEVQTFGDLDWIKYGQPTGYFPTS